LGTVWPEGKLMTEPLSVHGPVKLAITVDDLFLWPDAGHQNGYSPASCGASLIRAFAANGVSDVYAFSATFALDGDPRLTSVLDKWCDAGHHVGGHTHFHACLNWLDAKRYIEDLDQSHELIEPWVSRAPSRYFRFAMDMLGDTRGKTDEVLTHLAQTGFMHAPISYWFYDTQFVFPYARWAWEEAMTPRGCATSLSRPPSPACAARWRRRNGTSAGFRPISA